MGDNITALPQQTRLIQKIQNSWKHLASPCVGIVASIPNWLKKSQKMFWYFSKLTFFFPICVLLLLSPPSSFLCHPCCCCHCRHIHYHHNYQRYNLDLPIFCDLSGAAQCYHLKNILLMLSSWIICTLSSGFNFIIAWRNYN